MKKVFMMDVEVEPYWVVQTGVVAARMLIGAKRIRASTEKLMNMMQFEILGTDVRKTSGQNKRWSKTRLFIDLTDQ